MITAEQLASVTPERALRSIAACDPVPDEDGWNALRSKHGV